uniref:YqaJ viral recombinase domain-containing protein n=1 Tax=viral metagenome TaxID=1070528 RepID=A0A6C0JK41_9ZZZZ
METDSDYICEETDSINSTTSSKSSTKIVETIIESIFDEWQEEDVDELTNNMYQLFETYHEENMILISSPTFYETMLEHVCQIQFQDLLAGNLCNQEDYDELYEFAKNTLEVYLDFAPYVRRSVVYSSTLNEQKNRQVEATAKKIKALQDIPQPKQKSKEWHEFRYNLISASNLWKALGSESQKNSLIYEKCCPLQTNQINYFNSTESPMHWGNKYEPLTVMIYEQMYQTTVGDFGCIMHQNYPFIGASPDGINIDPTNQLFGRMLEIKNIVNREITGIPKEEYWIQTQIQMETCDLEECDFVETRFLEYSDEAAFYADESREHLDKGVILCFIERTITANNQVAKSNDPVYVYMPLDVSLDKDTIAEWTRHQKEDKRETGLVLLNTIYWYLEEFSCVFIGRNRAWFEAAAPKIEAVWKTILEERVSGYEHRAPKKKSVRKINASIDDSTQSYMLENMPVTNSFCLIKLDEDGNVL